MALSTSHIIQRQVFELSTTSSKASFEWEERASAYLHRVINPAIEACFNSLVSNNEHLVIDKLEIDLGSFTPENFEKEVTGRLMEKLGSVLRAYHQTASTSQNGFHQNESGNAERKILTQKEQRERAKEPRLINTKQALQSALLHFLLKGRFPWWYLPGDNTVPETESSKEESTPTTAGNFSETQFTQGRFDAQFNAVALLPEQETRELKEALRTSAAARIRLVNHFSAKWIAAFLQSIGLSGDRAMQQWTLLSYAVKNLVKINALFHQYFWMAWIEASFHGMQSINISLLIERTAGGYNDLSITLAKRIHEICYEAKGDSTFAGYMESIVKYFADGNHYDAFRKKIPDEITAGNIFISKQNNDPAKHSVDKALDEILQPLREQKKENKNFDDDDALFVEAAGLVILHPFLAELFKETGLWDEEQWCSDDSVYRAVQLLSWLAFGESGLPENRLLLFKIFTGLDAEAPLPAISPITPEEINACNELLDAILRHWKALRSTSIDGLQQGFLQREGKISQTEKGYQLVVERKAQDVLLSHLPWGYSMIRLPWIEQMINVTWI